MSDAVARTYIAPRPPALCFMVSSTFANMRPSIAPCRRLSREFCFASIDTAHLPPSEQDCEIVQFASSIVREPGEAADSILIGYGAQDHTPLVVSQKVEHVLSMLLPLPN